MALLLWMTISTFSRGHGSSHTAHLQCQKSDSCRALHSGGGGGGGGGQATASLEKIIFTILVQNDINYSLDIWDFFRHIGLTAPLVKKSCVWPWIAGSQLLNTKCLELHVLENLRWRRRERMRERRNTITFLNHNSSRWVSLDAIIPVVTSLPSRA
jgi:hypothetical protein